ncbi:K02A2.6, partial [Symbiodinium sp. CCMP2456]
ALVAAVVADRVVIGERDMSHAVSEAVAAYNSDPTSEGVSPLQCVTGRQPAAQGSVLNNFAGRLAEHGLIDTDPNLNQRMALRESARIAMVRLHYSQSIRKAELARSREPTASQPPVPGDVVYFWRAQKLTRRGDPRVSTSSRRRRLELKRWHGPAVLIALEASGETGFPTNAFLSFKSQVTKCALEHVRAASSLEQLAANAWEEAIKELVDGLDRARGSEPAAAVPEDEPVDDDLELAAVALGNVAPSDWLPSSSPAATATMTGPSAPSTAAPGTPVGQLLQRPVLQRALGRARQQPLAMELGQHALRRGQPADFQAELRDAMMRSTLRRTSSEAGFADGPSETRRAVQETSGGAPTAVHQQYPNNLLVNLLGFLLQNMYQQYPDNLL